MARGARLWKVLCLALAASMGPLWAAEPVEQVELRVREAFDRALARYPEPIRSRLNEIDLVRERDFGVPEDAPLMMRLVGAAAYAYFDSGTGQVVILDSGVEQRAVWTGGDASRDEIIGLLRDLSSALDAPEEDIESQWRAFVEAVQAWEGEPRIAGEIRFGDGRVLDRFVRLGLGRALAREWEGLGELDLDAQMVHELAHAVQLSGGLWIVTDRLKAWGKLSGWVRTDDGRAFDGIWGGRMRMESPAVLGRLLLSGERGEGLYAHAPGARFVNLYSAYDAREDYAESVRLFLEDPSRLLSIAPQKFLFMNSIGYNDRLDVTEPGPLWISESEILGRGWLEDVQGAAVELLSGREGITQDPRTTAALLRAHAGVIRAEGLPRNELASRMPRDVPSRVRAEAPLSHFIVMVGEEPFGPPRESVLRLWEEMATQQLERIEFDRSIRPLLGVDNALIHEFRQTGPELETEERATRIDIMLSIRADSLDPELLAAWAREEVRALHDARRPLLARAIALRLAMLTDDEATLDAKIDSARELASRFPTGYDAVELGRVLVDAMLQRGDVMGAAIVADGIHGELWGLLRRVQSLCAIARQTGDKVWLERAEGEIERSGRGSDSPLWSAAWEMIRDGEMEIIDRRSGE